tara:strand:+ start:4658 stop:6880 length:2223 start_codon:yes stop_codon:yes gene_type:complete
LIKKVTGDSNIDLGFDYWKNTFKVDDRYLIPVLPGDCVEFDETFYVDQKSGSDINDGLTRATSFKTINKAMDVISSVNCSLIRVASGVYLEVLDFAYGEKNKTTIFGESREETVILSKAPLDSWEKLAPEDCPEGLECDIYKKEISNELAQNYHLHYKDKIITPVNVVGQYSFREVLEITDLLSGVLPNDGDEDGLPDYKVTDDMKSNAAISGLTSLGRDKFKNHMLSIMMSDAEGLRYIGSSVMDYVDLSFEGIEAIYYIHKDLYADEDPSGDGASTIYFRALDGEENPTNFISASLGYSVFIRDSSNLVIQNLSIKNGRYNTYIYRNSHNIKILGNIFKGGYRNIYVNGSFRNGTYHSPSNLLISGNQITNNFSLTTDPQSEGHFRNFLLIKEILSDAHGVYLLNAGENITINNNFIYGVANGIQTYNTDTNYIDNNLGVHHNLIINVIDDALEPGGLCQNCKWHHNHIRNAAQSIRLKLKDELSVGPVFIFKNITINSDKFSLGESGVPFHNSNTEIYFHTGSTVPINIYNNSFNGSRCLVMPTGGNIEEAGANFYFINNIFNCRYSMGKIRVGAYPSGITEGEKNLQILFSHNWLGGEFDDRPSWQNGRLYLDDHEMFSFDGTNMVETSGPGQVGLNFYGGFIGSNSDNHHLIRTNFCNKKFSDTLSGLDVSDLDNLIWNYEDQVQYSGNTYVHNIDRRIKNVNDEAISLPGIIGEYVGPFDPNASDCSDFKWLLP